MNQIGVVRCVTHSRKVMTIAKQAGWLPGVRYTHLRDTTTFERIGFLDIDWKRYDFDKHIRAVKALRPLITVAHDVESIDQLPLVLKQAQTLAEYSKYVVLVPKDHAIMSGLYTKIPKEYLLGYSVPTRYGGTSIPPHLFERPVHLLGGRPDVQRQLADLMPVVSFDCNRFTLDARYGDYFDGEIFRPHPSGGYENCIIDSISNINRIWQSYYVRKEHKLHA